MSFKRVFLNVVVMFFGVLMILGSCLPWDDDCDPDKTPPTITLNGKNPMELIQGTEYKELGAVAIDDRDGNVTVTISGVVDSSKIGTYTITYSAKDKAGNEASKNRTVEVIKSTSQKTKGYLLDSPLQGITYICDNKKALTDKNGMFECSNPPITFKIGNLILGTLNSFTADGKVYPQDLLGLSRDNFTDKRLILLLRLLQSLDNDGNIEQSIDITKGVRDYFTESKKIEDLTIDDIEKITQDLGKTLISSLDALSHLRKSLNKEVSYVEELKNNIKFEPMKLDFKYIPSLNKNINFLISTINNENRVFNPKKDKLEIYTYMSDDSIIDTSDTKLGKAPELCTKCEENLTTPYALNFNKLKKAKKYYVGACIEKVIHNGVEYNVTICSDALDVKAYIDSDTSSEITEDRQPIISNIKNTALNLDYICRANDEMEISGSNLLQDSEMTLNFRDENGTVTKVELLSSSDESITFNCPNLPQGYRGFYLGYEDRNSSVYNIQFVKDINNIEKFHFVEVTLPKKEYEANETINFDFILEKYYSDFDQVQLFSYVSQDEQIDDHEFENMGYGIDEHDFENNIFTMKNYIKATSPNEKGTYFVGICAKNLWKNNFKVVDQIHICSSPIEIKVVKGKDDDNKTQETLITKLESIYIPDTNITLREDGKKTIKVIGRYSDGSSKDITSSVAFSVEDNGVCVVENGVITALSRGNTTLKATIDKYTSNEVNIAVIETIDTSAIVKNSLYDQYKHLIPIDSTIDYDVEKFAIITGTVKDKSDTPIENVTIQILNHNKYGSVKTDENGRFSIPVEGGATFTVSYQKDGYLLLHREIDVPTQDWANIDNVAMSQLDTKVTEVNLTKSTPQIHISSKIVDERGERETTLVFNGVSKATVIRRDGTTKELTDIKVRATEFDKPEKMPAKLPEGTAFTYCSALTVDGVEAGSEIEFDKPVVIYLDNFLGFEVGEAVPVGYYDEKKGEWKAYDNGVVVKLLDSDGDGKVDGLDSNGDDIADDLNGDGTTTDEVAGIKDSDKYSAGNTYWRAEVPHFSTWDLNYGSKEKLNEDDRKIEDEREVKADTEVEEKYSQCSATDSYVDIQNQVYHEDIKIAGTDITLHYASNRVEGYKHVVTTKVSGDEIPSALIEIIAKLEVAGRTITKRLPAKANQSVEFVWDGLDNNGKKVEGSVRGKVSVGYKYKAYYLKPPYARKSFGMYSNDFTDVEANPIIKWKVEVITLNNTINKQEIAGGWSLSSHHQYLNGITLKGDGTSLDKKIELEKGLLSYWKFENNAKDSSGNGHNGIEEGNITYIDGKIGKAIKFDGKTTLVRTPPLFFTKEFTIAYWLRVDSYVSEYIDHRDNAIFENTRESNSLSRFGMYFDNNNKISGFVRRDEDDGEDILSDSTLEFNKWYHIVFRKKNNKYQIYINGVLDTEKTITFELLQNATFMGLGDDVPNDGNAKFNGSLDEFRIYDRALSRDEISDLYTLNKLDSYQNSLKIKDNSQTYLFDIDGKHLKTLDTQTDKTLTTFEYDSDDNLIAIKDRFNNTITIERDGDGKPTAIIAPNGHRTTLTIDENNNLVDIHYEDNSNYAFTYSNGLMISETEPNGNTFTHEFDTNGRITKVSDQEGGWKSYLKEADKYTVATAEGNTKTIEMNGISNKTTSFSGKETTTSYSNNGMTKTQKSCNIETVTNYEYDEKTEEQVIKDITLKLPSGKSLTSTTDRTYTYKEDNSTKTLTIEHTTNGKTTTTTTDYEQGITTITSPEGRVTKSYFDTSTLLPTKSEITGISPTTYTYDSKGRLTSTTTGERTQSITYDSRGNIATITDAEGKVTRMEYDLLGRVTKTTMPSGAVLSYSYDKNGNMTILTTPKSNTHTFTYNKVNKKVSYSSAKAHNTIYEYNLERKLKKITYPSGKFKKYNYTKGLLTSIQTDEGNTLFEYDCLENITKTTYGSESIGYSYDGTLLKSLTFSGLLNQTIGFAYNDDFKLSKLSYAGESDTLVYDNDGLLIKRGNFSITRDANNGLPLALFDGTLTMQRGYNTYGEVDEVSNKIGQDSVFLYRVERDKVGKITKKVETIAGDTHTYVYRYDDDGRLIEVKKDGEVSESYSYDSNGNRSGSTVNEDDQLLNYKGVTYSYNDDGYLISKHDSSGTTTYEYGIYGELKKVVLPDGKVVEYLHNANHQRVAKKVNGTIIEKYLWLNLTTLLATYDKNDNLIQRFEYADNRMPVAMQQDGKRYYLHYDQVGTLKLITDSSGTTIKTIEYDSYGNVLSDSNPSFTIPFGFAGGLYDSDTKLTRFGYRDYDSFSGRWTAKDPIGFNGGDSNLYGYVLGDSVNFVDENGLKTYRCKKALFGGDGQRWGPDIYGNPFYHQYTCVGNPNANISCGGQTRAGNPILSPGIPSNDVFDKNLCTEDKTKDKNIKFEACMRYAWTRPRPPYGIGMGVDCQEYDDLIYDKCSELAP